MWNAKQVRGFFKQKVSATQALNETFYPRLPQVGPTEKQVSANRSRFKYYYFGLTQNLQRRAEKQVNVSQWTNFQSKHYFTKHK